MIFTRLGYLIILVIIVVAAGAIAYVVWPGGGGSGGASNGGAASRPVIAFDDVINYSKFGVIDQISVKGSVLTAHFRDDFDTKSRTGSDSHDYTSALPSGQDLAAVLQTAGVQGVKIVNQ